MTDASAPIEHAPAGRSPRWRRTHGVESAAGGKRLIETTVLLLAGVLLAVATLNDVGRQAHINHRLVDDMRTWRTYTGHASHNLSVGQNLYSTREVVCGNERSGHPSRLVQLCLAVRGPVVDGRRAVTGGYYLPAKVEDLEKLRAPPPKVEDLRARRYACFGSAKIERRCPR